MEQQQQQQLKVKDAVFSLHMELVRNSVSKMGQILSGEAEATKSNLSQAVNDVPTLEDQADKEQQIEELKAMVSVFLVDIQRYTAKVKDLEKKLDQKDTLIKDYTEELAERIQELEQIKSQTEISKEQSAKTLNQLQQDLLRKETECQDFHARLIETEDQLHLLSKKFDKVERERAKEKEVLKRMQDHIAEKGELPREEMLLQPPATNGDEESNSECSSTPGSARVKDLTELSSPFEAMNTAAPTGKVTFVFTVLPAASFLWEKSAVSMRKSISVHNDTIRAAIALHYGYEVKTQVDAFEVAFQNCLDAARFCLYLQEKLLQCDWPNALGNYPLTETKIHPGSHQTVWRGLRVGMALHMGEPHAEIDPVTGRVDYYGAVVNRTAGLAKLAQGGMTLITREVYSSVQPFLMEQLNNPIVEDLGTLPDSDGSKFDVLRVTPASLLGRLDDWPKGVVQSPSEPLDVADFGGAPAGKVTFVYVCIEGAAELEKLDKLDALATYRDIVRQELANSNGFEISAERDRFFLSFVSPTVALKYCFQIQSLLLTVEWPRTITKNQCASIMGWKNQVIFNGPRTQIGVHFCEAAPVRDDFSQRVVYHGSAATVAPVIAQSGKGGEIRITGDVCDELCESLDELGHPYFCSQGWFRIKEHPGSLKVFVVMPRALEGRLYVLRGIEETATEMVTQTRRDIDEEQRKRLRHLTKEKERRQMLRETEEEKLRKEKEQQEHVAKVEREATRQRIIAAVRERQKIRAPSTSEIRLSESTGNAPMATGGEAQLQPQSQSRRESRSSQGHDGQAAYARLRQSVTTELIYGSLVKQPKGRVQEEVEQARMFMEDRYLLDTSPLDAVPTITLTLADLESFVSQAVAEAATASGIRSRSDSTDDGNVTADRKDRHDLPANQRQAAELTRRLDELNQEHQQQVHRIHQHVRYWSQLLRDYIAALQDSHKPPMNDDEFVLKWVNFHRSVYPERYAGKKQRKTKEEFKDQLSVTFDEAEEKLFVTQSEKLVRSLIGHLGKAYVAVMQLVRKRQRDLNNTASKASRRARPHGEDGNTLRVDIPSVESLSEGLTPGTASLSTSSALATEMPPVYDLEPMQEAVLPSHPAFGTPPAALPVLPHLERTADQPRPSLSENALRGRNRTAEPRLTRAETYRLPPNIKVSNETDSGRASTPLAMGSGKGEPKTPARLQQLVKGARSRQSASLK